MNIRAKTFERWLKANFTRSELQDIAEHGANMGWRGLAYYSQTTELYAKFKEDIWKHITEESEANGSSNPFEYLAMFRYADSTCDAITMENWLVWYAAESMAYQITQYKNHSRCT